MGRIAEHNQEIRRCAQNRAFAMRFDPSKLEEKMQKFLDKHHIYYTSQEIFYIYDDSRWITTYYIADFYVPDKKIIIEVDGKKYHEHHSQKDRDRTRAIQKNYPGVEVLRYTWHDLDDFTKMDELLCTLCS